MRQSRLTDNMIWEAYENQKDTHTQEDIARQLGISQSALSQRLKNMQRKSGFDLKIKEYARKKAISVMEDLRKQSSSGKTEASKLILELADIYTQKKQVDVNAEIKNKIDSMKKDAEEIVERIQSEEIS